MHLQVQQPERSGELAPENWRDSPKPQKQGITIEILTTVCEIFLSGWRSSQIIWRTQNCLHPHDSGSERPSEVALRKHSVKAQFPKDRNCEICPRTKITRAPCRRRIGEAAPRAEKFGDLITADHKVLSEDGESSHRQSSTGSVAVTATCATSPLSQITSKTPIRCRCSRSCQSMDSILSGDGKAV